MNTTAAEIVETKATNRFFVRCRDCLSIAAVEVEEPSTLPNPSAAMTEDARRFARIRRRCMIEDAAAALIKSAACGLCEGKLDNMGRVTIDNRIVLRAYDKCACDARCQGARGPSCDCPCGGKNHGTSVTVPVVVYGDAPRIAVKDSDKARKVAAEWRAEVARALATRPARLARMHAEGSWLAPADYRTAEHFRAVYSHARGLKTHKARMAEIARVQEHGIA